MILEKTEGKKGLTWKVVALMEIKRFEISGLKCVEALPEKPARDLPLIIGLHGRGDWGESYINIGSLISETKYRYIFPTAPLALPGALFEWFRFDYDNPGKEAKEARQVLLSFIGDLASRYSLPPAKIFLCGFSQGGMMALEAGLRFKDSKGTRLAGLACLSGALLANTSFNETHLADPASYYSLDQGDLKQTLVEAARDKIPVFIGHGSFDPVVPVVSGKLSRDFLKKAGLEVEYFEFPGQHEISFPEIKALASFIDRSLSDR